MTRGLKDSPGVYTYRQMMALLREYGVIPPMAGEKMSNDEVIARLRDGVATRTKFHDNGQGEFDSQQDEDIATVCDQLEAMQRSSAEVLAMLSVFEEQRNAAVDARHASEAACAAMRQAFEALSEAASDGIIEKYSSERAEELWDAADRSLALDAGRGWMSPDKVKQTQEQLEAERACRVPREQRLARINLAVKDQAREWKRRHDNALSQAANDLVLMRAERDALASALREVVGSRFELDCTPTLRALVAMQEGLRAIRAQALGGEFTWVRVAIDALLAGGEES